ncbi:hypothetical protein FRIG_01735 [Frigoribacterium faeni]|uniref:hypothetical protein n=1 Tax=Frigoribacterium faeni TaxID=145483 RepID=UPI001FAD21CF|nr:hypothetical protein [Frigoribacterium faeni]MCJ0699859.1 hypothetical protein [Frigoribacterium faeni]
MMSRIALRCEGCENPFTARIGAAPTDLTRFYLLCPICGLPIRGRATGQELKEFKIEFEDAERMDAEIPRAPVVTVDPSVPAKRDADSDSGLGSFTMQTFLILLGDGLSDYFSDAGTAVDAATERWTGVRRIWTYYLDKSWILFDKAGKSTFPDWVVASTDLDRTRSAYRALEAITSRIVGTRAIGSTIFLDRYRRKDEAAIRVGSYGDLLRQDVADGRTQTLERDLFALVDTFARNYDIWALGRLPRHLPDSRKSSIIELTLFRDDFSQLRDLYQQGFELVCKSTRFVVAAQNTVKRGDPNDFGTGVPASLNAKQPPATLKAFDKLPNASRLAYVSAVPGWEGLTNLLNNRTRNAIGHATAHHDLRSGKIVSDIDPAGTPYLDFVGYVFDVFDAVAAAVQVLRTARVNALLD